MEPIFKSNPFPHVLIPNFFLPEECDDVWQEIKRLSNVRGTPEQTQSSFYKDEKGQIIYKKNNSGVFLSQVYKNLMVSPIARGNRKLFDSKFMAQCVDFSFLFGYLPLTNWDSTLVQFYENEQYYKSHVDDSIFSAVTNFSSNPKEYDGGVLKFTDFNYGVDLQPNECILFPSFVSHEVTPVILKTNDLMKSRITITTFIAFHEGNK